MKLPNPVLIICLLTLLISACTQAPIKPADTQEIAPAEAMQLEKTAEDYLAQATLSMGDERDQLLLKAAGLYIDASHFENARNTISSINIELATAETLRSIQLLSARIALGLGKPRDALKLLSFSDILPVSQQI